MSISFYAGKNTGDGCINWVFTSEEMNKQPELEVNMTNRNAAYVLYCLGIALENGYFQVPIDEMVSRCTEMLKKSIRRKRLGIEPTIEQKAGGPTFIDVGIDEGYVEKQVLRIAILAREGKARGAQIIYGC